MVAKKTATAKKAEPAPTVVEPDITISPELVEARDAALKAEAEFLKNLPQPEETSISPELVEAREAALKAEKKK
jgi:hypothetical protein